MNVKQKTLWRRSAGVTLVEVLASLLLMGSLIVGLVLARGRLVQQHADAQAKLQAVEVADAILAQWWAQDPPAVPVDAQGEIASHPGWIWQTQHIDIDATHPAAQSGVRLMIIDQNRPPPEVRGSVGTRGYRILTQVDLLSSPRSGEQPSAPRMGSFQHTDDSSSQRFETLVYGVYHDFDELGWLRPSTHHLNHNLEAVPKLPGEVQP